MMEYLYKPYTNKQYADFVVANQGRKLMSDKEKVWFEDYPIIEPTIEEQNEAIRQTRESLYRATSDYLKADYDEAIARGADNVEELKQKWLESKDKIREENPYVAEEGEEVPTEDAALPIEESKIETSVEEPETPVPSSSVSLEDDINSVVEK